MANAIVHIIEPPVAADDRSRKLADYDEKWKVENKEKRKGSVSPQLAKIEEKGL
ncbi:MAG: hypothetical protein KJ826_19945 [Proteobacteria bacterium]|nr:hypothetical protein [Pseudomonadota bacterium]MBU4036682.1 hypothetical protein [Pseudomonadota bacterium]